VAWFTAFEWPLANGAKAWANRHFVIAETINVRLNFSFTSKASKIAVLYLKGLGSFCRIEPNLGVRCTLSWLFLLLEVLHHLQSGDALPVDLLHLLLQLFVQLSFFS
jgi:hypothetical protein